MERAQDSLEQFVLMMTQSRAFSFAIMLQDEIVGNTVGCLTEIKSECRAFIKEHVTAETALLTGINLRL